jgi:hypothetical protein
MCVVNGVLFSSSTIASVKPISPFCLTAVGPMQVVNTFSCDSIIKIPALQISHSAEIEGERTDVLS